MNLFDTVKANVSVPEAARAYGLTVTRASSSIRTSTTASDAERKAM